MMKRVYIQRRGRIQRMAKVQMMRELNQMMPSMLRRFERGYTSMLVARSLCNSFNGTVVPNTPSQGTQPGLCPIILCR